jgi:hypothetical protein
MTAEHECWSCGTPIYQNGMCPDCSEAALGSGRDRRTKEITRVKANIAVGNFSRSDLGTRVEGLTIVTAR